jgi:integrase
MALAMARPWKHPKTGIYWLRKRVPDDLRALVGKQEYKRSLKTKDPAEAKRLHAASLAEIESLWSALRKPVAATAPGLTCLSERQAHERAAWVYGYWLNLHRENPSCQTLWNTSLYDKLWAPELRAPRESPSQSIQDQLSVADMLDWCRRQAESVLIARYLEVDDQSRRNLEKAIAAAAQRASLVLKKWAVGDFDGIPAPADPRRAAMAPAGQSITFDFLLAGWEAERRPLPKTAYEYKRVIRDLRSFLGHDDPGKAASADIVRWKSHLIAAGLHAKTIKDAKLAPARAILQWGVDNHHLQANPATRVTMDVKRRAGDGKRGFTDDEATRILTAASLERDPAKQWIPLLGAYTGARIAELSQLRAEDIAIVDDILCMRITPDAGSLKTVSSERVVPLHPAVIKAGFGKFVTGARKGPLFASLKPDVFGSRGGNGTKILGRWVRQLGVTDERISPSHSWRHRFKTLARKHGLAVDISDAITGHSGKTVASRYGDFPVEALYRELLKIPGLRIEPDGEPVL